jgi:hypothetical protein
MAVSLSPLSRPGAPKPTLPLQVPWLLCPVMSVIAVLLLWVWLASRAQAVVDGGGDLVGTGAGGRAVQRQLIDPGPLDVTDP